MKITSSYPASSGVPLGGIGTGSMEIRADGRLYEWHIFNNGRWAWRDSDREKEFMDPSDFFLVVRIGQSKKTVVRVLQSHRGFVYGGDPYTLPWFRSVDCVEFTGEPPLVTLSYRDSDFPVDVSAKVFSPFIPGNVKDSSLPVAIFVFDITNTTGEKLEFSILAAIKNPFCSIPGRAEISFQDVPNGKAIVIRGLDISGSHPMYNGSITVGITGEKLEYGWKLAAPYDHQMLHYTWVEFRSKGILEDANTHVVAEEKNYSMISAKRILEPGEKSRLVILVSWFFPNHIDALGNRIGHMYENWFSSSLDVAKYVAENFERLKNDTFRFHDILYRTTVDYWLIDLIASQLTTLVKSTYYTKEGLFGVWEGYGCCGLNTTDVAFYGSIMILQLFPELEKKWLEYHAKWQLKPELSPYYEAFTLAIPENINVFKGIVRDNPDVVTDPKKMKDAIKEVVTRTGKDPRGRIPHFFVGSFARPDTYDRPDMNPEYVLMSIRDAIWLGDKELLRRLWDTLREATECILRIHDEANTRILYHYTPAGYEAMKQSFVKAYGWAPSFLKNFLGMVASGYTFFPVSVQTFDQWSLVGVTSFTGLIWLASLKAMEKASSILEDVEYAKHIQEIYRVARDNFEKLLWNGEYFDLWYDPISGKRDKGCASAQLDGQICACLLLDLGYIVDREKIISVLASIYKYNFVADEGLINGSYPNKPRPSFAGDLELPNETGLMYTVGSQIDTPWTGIELEVGAYMIHEGMTLKGLRVLKSLYDRYARYGELWNHIECGGHYYRSMVSWLVLIAIEGLFYDGFTKTLRFMPKLNSNNFKGLLTLTGSWGTISQLFNDGKQEVSIEVARGNIKLKNIVVEKKGDEIKSLEAKYGDETLEASYTVEGDEVYITLSKEVLLKDGERLQINVMY